MLENTKRNVIGGVGDDFGLRAILWFTDLQLRL